jgi:hypothetical protein
LSQKRKPQKSETPLFRGGLDLYREEFGRQRSGYILAYRTLKGGSGCGFSVGFTLFSPAPVFNLLPRADDFAFFAFIRVSPLFAFRLLAWSPSSCVPPQLLAANRFAFSCAALSLHATSAPIQTANSQKAMRVILRQLPPHAPAVKTRLPPTASQSQLISQRRVEIFNIPAPDAPR